MAQYFTPGFFDFFRDLKRHNDREWFAANRERYVASVEAPVLQFIGDFAPHLRAISPAFTADRRRVGGSMFRIHRDTRFSPDKSPYKLWTAARFAHESRRKESGGVPGFFLHLGPGESFGGGGVYHIEMPQLTKIRRRIVDAPQDWAKVRARVEVQGEQLKRAPAGFSASHEHIEDLRRQNLYALKDFTEADVVSGDFMERFVASCQEAAPLIEFETKALGLRW
ncbi:MAG TPA: DUF2461 domain-containing protein [Vicinamibacterales bacterium]|nr:DUF2461 domain-containing protein [Vicinamibacterales bacterium]